MEAMTNNGKYFMVMAAFLTATGQLFWKLGFTDHYLIAVGFVCYGIGAWFMIKAFALEKLAVAYPIMSTSYIFAICYSHYFLAEAITFEEIVAVCFLVIGVSLTSYE